MSGLSVCIIILSVGILTVSAGPKCDVFVDITDGIREGTNITLDNVTYTENDFFASDDGSIKGCICQVRSCARKCCSDHQVLDMTTKTCVASSTKTALGVIVFHVIDVPDNKFCDDTDIRIKIDKDFSLIDGVLIWDDINFALEDYCLAVTAENKTFALACVVDQEGKIEGIITCLGMIISMPFLLMTFLVYAILPESNIHRKALMCYVLSLLIGYIFLVSIQLNNSYIQTFWCHFLGYGIIFFFISSFFWMNVMCVDMWLAFSGLRGFKGKRSTERKRFLAYFAYALGMPLLLVFIVFLLNTYSDEKSIFHPKLGGARCFLEEGYPNLFYFSLPMAIIIGINMILFILTAVRIQKVKKETSMLKQSDSKRHSYEEEKQKFNLYLKLLFAMGINWSMEVISWAVGWKLKTVPAYIWYLTDFTNAAYGVFIFLIFVFKRKIWNGLKKKYYLMMNKPHLAHTLSTSHPTRTSNYSTTDTAVSTDCRLSDMKNARVEEQPLSRN